jgi:hypothetical protein
LETTPSNEETLRPIRNMLPLSTPSVSERRRIGTIVARTTVAIDPSFREFHAAAQLQQSGHDHYDANQRDFSRRESTVHQTEETRLVRHQEELERTVSNLQDEINKRELHEQELLE